MILAGDSIDAMTAERWGLVTETLTARTLPRAGEIAHRIAARAPIAAQMGKLNLRVATSMDLRVPYSTSEISKRSPSLHQMPRKESRPSSRSVRQRLRAANLLKCQSHCQVTGVRVQ